ncbi:hypothetical protein CQY20_09315 [Mycolicibacterium agri]|uniref:DUF4381 domain-containing protein n=1 Tax=Mycolicibacterium agri TaxID=36811 RepID=A0A2A7N6N5_MYCAG|nr:hypothetical protein [Mycolicibacterium agri]PEG39742.1 hypothetical protein CQY20_09315 [Mycolicibacterium agri]GFG52549.1 hypothetical protein MAGR_39900 [Mycolicibacterium agri]
MPDDLLRFVVGPTPYSTLWLWLGLLTIAAVIAWYAAVLLWTQPAHRLRTMPGLRVVHAKLLRRRFARSVHAIGERHRAGELSAAQAGAQMSRTLRSFLHQATGIPAQYMHVDEIASTELADTAPLLAAFNDVQFNTDSEVALSTVGASTEEMIRTWA